MRFLTSYCGRTTRRKNINEDEECAVSARTQTAVLISTWAKRPVAATGKSVRVAVEWPPRARRALRRETWRPATRPAGPAVRPAGRRRPCRPSWTASFSWPSAAGLLVLPSCDVCKIAHKSHAVSNEYIASHTIIHNRCRPGVARPVTNDRNEF